MVTMFATPAYAKDQIKFKWTFSNISKRSYPIQRNIARVTGYPGTTISYSKEFGKTMSIGYQLSGTLAAPASNISAAVGFNVTTHYTEQVSGSTYVPYWNNGKRVKYCTLYVDRQYIQKTFTVTRVDQGGLMPTKTSKGESKIGYQFIFRPEFYYY
jgi:hypothetical protein